MKMNNLNKGEKMEKTFHYWVADEEMGQLYFDTADRFLTYLQENDPVECGAKELTEKEFNDLDND